MQDDASDIAIVTAFLRHYGDDRRQGIERSLGEYQRRFPGFEEAIAREYRTLMSGGAHANDAVANDHRESPTELARGGMGIVYRAWDGDLQRQVAKKVLRRAPRPGGTLDLRAADRFVGEARITGQLGHPGIVPVHSLGHEADGTPWFTMPIVEGQDLSLVIRAQRSRSDPNWTLPRVVEVLLRVCDAVAFAHDKQIVHRDLKPQNVMVGRFGEVYVLDWGLARSLAEADPQRDEAAGEAALAPTLGATVDGDVVGTPAYMPPEQARGDLAAIDQRADVYSIGAILYELLAGQPPYFSPGGDNSTLTVLRRVLAGPPAPLPALRDVPAELVAVCRKAMAREPERRYQSVLALAADLRAFVDQRVVRAYEVGALAELRKWVRRNRALAAASAVALLALVAGFTYSTTQKLAAERNARLAERNATTAEQNARVAAENLEVALTAGDDLLGKVGLHALENEAGSDPLRQELIAKALDYYTRLQGLRGDHPRVLEKIALAHERIADLEAQIGHPDKARSALQAARQAHLQLVERFGRTDALRHRLAALESQQASLLAQSGEPAAALARMEHAAAELAELRQRGPDRVPLLADAAMLAHGMAMTCMALGQVDQALRYSSDEVELSRRLVQLAPDRPWPRSQLGWSLQLRGMILWQLGRGDEAEIEYRAGIDVLSAAQRDEPGHRGIRFRLSEIQNLHAILLLEAGRPDEAGELLQAAVQLLDGLVGEYPGVRGYHGGLGGALCNLGILHRQQGRADEAMERFEAALPQVRRALEIDPSSRDHRDYRRTLGIEMAQAALDLGQHARAGECLRELITEQGRGMHWRCARLLARCVVVVHDDGALTQPERERLAEDYASQAVAWLATGLQEGKVAAEAWHDGALDPLRGREDFAALRAASSK